MTYAKRLFFTARNCRPLACLARRIGKRGREIVTRLRFGAEL